MGGKLIAHYQGQVSKWLLNAGLEIQKTIEGLCGREAYVPIPLQFFKLLGIH